MKFARAPVIVQPIGHVGVLLDLDDTDAGPDRMYGICGDVEEVARFDVMPGKQIHDRPILRAALHLIARNGALETDSELRPGLGIEHVPAFLLARPAQTRCHGLIVIGMHLHR